MLPKYTCKPLKPKQRQLEHDVLQLDFQHKESSSPHPSPPTAENPGVRLLPSQGVCRGPSSCSLLHAGVRGGIRTLGSVRRCFGEYGGEHLTHVGSSLK